MQLPESDRRDRCVDMGDQITLARNANDRCRPYSGVASVSILFLWLP